MLFFCKMFWLPKRYKSSYYQFLISSNLVFVKTSHFGLSEIQPSDFADRHLVWFWCKNMFRKRVQVWLHSAEWAGVLGPDQYHQKSVWLLINFTHAVAAAIICIMTVNAFQYIVWDSVRCNMNPSTKIKKNLYLWCFS